MKWRAEPKPKQNPEEWHKWFAWKPVGIWSDKDDCLYKHWLCFVERRKIRIYSWEYRSLVYYY